MLGYQLFYHVKRSKKPDYTETKFYALEKDATHEAIQLCMCDNVDFVTIRTVEVKSISLTVLKKPDTVEISEPYEDLSCPKFDFDKIDVSDLNVATVNQFQHDNPIQGCKSFNEYIQEHFNAK